MVHGEDSHEQSNVTRAIYAEDVKSVFDRSRPSLEKSDQQDRRDADDLPSRGQEVERTCGEREQGSECEQVQQKEKPQEPRFTMKVGRGELPDQS